MGRILEAESLRDPLSPREMLRAERLARLIREHRLPGGPRRDPLVDCAHRGHRLGRDPQAKESA